MKTTKEKIEVMQAYADGEEIEARSIEYNTEWLPDSYPSWNWKDKDFRIKENTESRVGNYIGGTDSSTQNKGFLKITKKFFYPQEAIKRKG